MVKTKIKITVKTIFLPIIALLSFGVLLQYSAFLTHAQSYPTDTDLKIAKSNISSKAKFYPYKSGNTYMEVFAIKASDGTIRTAFNTCQVCYSSGRGYYIQEGNEMVCQNCGSRFPVDKIEVVRGGCNPVPILNSDKKDDGKNLIISKQFMAKNKFYFANWKKD